MAKPSFLKLLPLTLALSLPAMGDSPVPPAAPDSPAPVSAADAAKPLADAQDKLNTALHSYSLLQDENNQLKLQAEKAAAEKAALNDQLQAAQQKIDALSSQAASAVQVDPLRTELRQSQNEIASLAAANAELRTRLALAGATPGSPALAPTRPSPAAATPTPKAAATAGPKMASAPETPRIHIVVAGDSLGKISLKYYKTANRYEDIAKANPDVIHDENHLEVGMKLKIP